MQPFRFASSWSRIAAVGGAIGASFALAGPAAANHYASTVLADAPSTY
jgi:hypothetical protein